ncbi:MAG: hypothetical protein EOP87_22395 [Verrucomicrobiaceae bacterium]|nr:MAG: hypothetical protein EOP87_22395 [Verrucomicrobiaceae bacterium]
MRLKLVHFPLAGFLLSFPAANGAIAISTDFSTDLSGVTTSGGTNATAAYSTAGPGGSRALAFTDTGSGQAQAQFSGATGAFNTASAGQSELQIKFDFAATAMTGDVNAAGVPRIIFGPSTSAVTIAFGRSGPSADSQFILYAIRGNGIGPVDVDPAPGNMLFHSFGDYSTTAGNNSSGGYVTINISLLHGGTSVNVSATQGGNTLFDGVLNGFTAHAMTESNLNFRLATSTTNLSTTYLDNLLIQTIPEPSQALLAGGLGCLAFLRRRRA